MLQYPENVRKKLFDAYDINSILKMSRRNYLMFMLLTRSLKYKKEFKKTKKTFMFSTNKTKEKLNNLIFEII
jgi:hypothetical protein